MFTNFNSIAIAAVALILVLLIIILIVRRRLARPERLQQNIDQAAAALQSGKIEKSRRIYRTVIARANPKLIDDKGRNLRGVALLALGNLEQNNNNLTSALEYYLGAMPLISLPGDAIRILAYDFAAHGKATPEAIKLYLQYISNQTNSSTDDPVQSFLRSHIQITAQATSADVEASLRLADEILRANDTLAWAHRTRGSALIRLDQNTEAVKALTTAEGLNPQDAQASFFLGNLFADTCNWEAACAAYRRSLEREPLQPHTHYQLAQALLKRSEADPEFATTGTAEALSAMLEATRQDGLQHEFWRLRSQLERQQGDRQAAVASLTQAAAIQPVIYTYHWERASLLVEMGEKHSAIAPLQKALALNPQVSEAQLLMAQLLVAQARDQEAEAHFVAALRLDPTLTEAQNELGLLLFRLRRWREAVSQLKPTATRTGLLTLAHAYGHLQEYELAVKIYTEWQGKFGTDDEVLFYQAAALGNLRRWDESLRLLHQIQQTDTLPVALKADLHFLRGAAYLHLGQLDQAEKWLKQAATASPPRAQVHYALGLLCWRRGEAVEARQAFIHSIQQEPNAPAYFAIGMAEEKLASFEAAANAYGRGLKLDPEWSAAIVRMGIAQAKTGAWAKSLVTLAQAREKGVENNEAAFYTGLAHAKLGEWQEALTKWEALRHNISAAAVNGVQVDSALLDNNIAVVHDQMGRAAIERKNYAKAIEHWQEALRLTKRPVLTRCLAEAHVRAGIELLLATIDAPLSKNVERLAAVQHFDAALKLEPSDTRSPYYLALVSMIEGNWTKAQAQLERVVEHDSNHHRARYHLALLHLQEKNVTEAQHYLQQLASVADSYRPTYDIALGNVALLNEQWDIALDSFARPLQAGRPVSVEVEN